jgi:hypothetical protein
MILLETGENYIMRVFMIFTPYQIEDDVVVGGGGSGVCMGQMRNAFRKFDRKAMEGKRSLGKHR